MRSDAASSRDEARSFDELRARLAAVADAAPPYVDPRSVALRALVVADYMTQPAARHKLAPVAKAGLCDLERVDDLREAARAVLFILSKLSDPLARGMAPVPEPLGDEARLRRRSMSEVVDDRLHHSDDARLWLEVIRQSKDDVDLMFDLRALERLYREHDAILREACDCALEAQRSRALADKLEAALGVAQPQSEWRDWLARAWTLLVPLFDEVSRIGHFALHDVPGVSFPSLAAIARVRRRRTMVDTPSRTSRRSLRSSPLPSEPPRTGAPPPMAEVATARGSESSMPAAQAPAPWSDIPAPAGEGRALGSEPPLARAEPVSTPPESNRSEPRFNVELEVSIFSDSNLYLGFTENLSTGGLFVATHILRPIGSSVEMSVRFPGRPEPLRLRGQVRWIREYSASSDAWPGMGVRFDTLGAEDEALMREFLRWREPIFFVE
jgi:uncharacterized protein (TIGR02266 family)